MPFTSSDFWDKDAEIITRVFSWQNSGLASEVYPAAPDDLWRFVAFGSIDFTKGAGAVANTAVRLNRENFVAQPPLWQRFMAIADTTAAPGFLQGGETQSEVARFIVFNFGGIFIPPRTQLEIECSNNVFTRFEGVMHESQSLAALKGLT